MFSAIKSSPSTITVPDPNVPFPMTLASCKQANKSEWCANVFRKSFATKPGDDQYWKQYCSKKERWSPGRFLRMWWSFSSWARTAAAGKSPVRYRSQSDKCFQEEQSQLRPEQSSSRRNHPPKPSLFDSSPFSSSSSFFSAESWWGCSIRRCFKLCLYCSNTIFVCCSVTSPYFSRV